MANTKLTELYKKLNFNPRDFLLGRTRPQIQNKETVIAVGKSFQNLLNHQGFKNLSKWMDMQDRGITAKLRAGVLPENGKTRTEVYDSLVAELKVYNKIMLYIQTTIEQGKAYEQELLRLEKKELGD